jgi:hypothetical protein
MAKLLIPLHLKFTDIGLMKKKPWFSVRLQRGIADSLGFRNVFFCMLQLHVCIMSTYFCPCFSEAE